MPERAFAGRGRLALVSAPAGILDPQVAPAARAWVAAGVQVVAVGDVPAAAAALAVQPPGSVTHLRLLGHGGPGTLALGLGTLHLRRHFLRAATAGHLFTPAAVAALAPAARVDLIGCNVGASAAGLVDPAEPRRFDGEALRAAVAACCPGRDVRATLTWVHQAQAADPPLSPPRPTGG